jgi:hypothetical protein
MCYWQRWPHDLAIVAAMFAFGLRNHVWKGRFVALAALGILVSGLIGVFHAGVEYGWWDGITRCTSTAGGSGNLMADIMNAPLIRCDQPQWEVFGISLAGFNALDFHLRRACDLRPAAPKGRMTSAKDSMIRVDQAGEYGAVRIYSGQLAVLGTSHPAAREISHMLAQEQVHLDRFNAVVAERGVRPTLLQPFWHVAGLCAGCCNRADRPQGGHGLHRGGGDRNRRPLWRTA